MSRATAEERALARAAVYRLLAIAFGYPSAAAVADLVRALPVAVRATEILDERVRDALEEVEEAGGRWDQAEIEAAYQRAFTLSYNEDCPLYETAFSARHIFQQTQQQADIAGFFRAFGVDARGERPDHISLELEFLYLLALKESRAREQKESAHVAVCRRAQRAFLRDHLVRWVPQVSSRVAVSGRGSLYEAVARLLLTFIRQEGRFLRLGAVEPFRDEPVLIADEPGEFTCPKTDTYVPVEIRGFQETS